MKVVLVSLTEREGMNQGKMMMFRRKTKEVSRGNDGIARVFLGQDLRKEKE